MFLYIYIYKHVQMHPNLSSWIAISETSMAHFSKF